MGCTDFFPRKRVIGGEKGDGCVRLVALLRIGFRSRFGEVSLHSTILVGLYDERLSEQWEFGLAI